MDLHGWDEKYRETAATPLEPPTPLLARLAQNLKPGRALDLACGAGRNALWLAQRRWNVTAVDGSAVAIDVLRQRATARNLEIDAHVADLEHAEFTIEPASWDLIAMCYYLQRDLFEPAKAGLRPGGLVLAIVHMIHADMPQPGFAASRFSLPPGELKTHFAGWDILHSYEGPPEDPAHKRWVAEIAARR